MSEIRRPTYASTGVDIERVETGLERLTSRLRGTWPVGDGLGTVKLDFGFYANVIDVGGIGLAITTDGVGSKVLVAQMMDKYDTVGIDCVAMNVNDLLCVGATPVSLVDYIALEDANPTLLEEIAKGLCEGAAQAGVSIVGGEIAQLKDIVRGVRPGYAFDLMATAVGTVELDRIIVGADVQDGDVLIGIESNGIHSNGLTLARDVLFSRNDCDVRASLPELECSLGEELLKPTHIYVKEVLELFREGAAVKALAHITGDGLLNLGRTTAEVGWDLNNLPPAPPIFSLIQELGDVSSEEMYRVFNMGIGFCVVVPPSEADAVISVVTAHGKAAYRIGRAFPDSERRIQVRPAGLVGRGKKFQKAGAP